MGLTFIGKTECCFCHEVLKEGEVISSFPALFPENHKYHLCSDSSFHTECFNQWKYSQSVLNIYMQYLKLQDNEKPELPADMVFSDFEKTDEYIEYMKKMEQLLSNE